MTADSAVIKSANPESKVLANGCCGMAGAYGYHSKTANVAKRIGEMELKPHLDQCSADAPIISDGFSCRSQVRNLSGKKALHLAEWLDLIQRSNDNG